VAPSRMVGVSASVNLPLNHKVQKFSSGTSSPERSRKKGRKTDVCVLLTAPDPHGAQHQKLVSDHWQLSELGVYVQLNTKLEMWANAQHDGRPAKYRWRPLFNAAVWLTPTTRVPCINAAKMRNPLKFARVPQTRQQISAVSRPKFTILWRHVQEASEFKFFFRLSIHASAAKIQPDKVVRWCQNGDILRPVFSASRVQHISDMHSKFPLRPYHVWKYGRYPISDCWD